MFRMFARTVSTATLVATLAAGVVALPATASADAWNRHHPARTEINHRIMHQRHRIAQERREGEITRGQAIALRADDHAVREQERADARADHHHGHLNRQQVHALNRELNANNGAIGR